MRDDVARIELNLHLVLVDLRNPRRQWFQVRLLVVD
jgi:hypothetical protein